MAKRIAHQLLGPLLFTFLLCGYWQSVTPAYGGDGIHRTRISYQNKSDLFYNYYEGPNPSGVTAGMYISPVPVPPHVGHTYTTYQPLMPHEYLYRHTRSHYSHQPGAGWTRTKVRYRTFGLRLDNLFQ